MTNNLTSIFLNLVVMLGSAFVGWQIGGLIIYYFKKRKATKEDQEKAKVLDAKRCKGAHSWITMEIANENTHVCQFCYYTPVHNNYVKEYYVKEYYVKEALEKKKFEEEFNKYLEEKFKELSKEYNIDSAKIKEIVEKSEKMKQEYSLIYLRKLLADIGIKSGE